MAQHRLPNTRLAWLAAALVAIVVALAAASPAGAVKSIGQWNQADIDNAISAGVDYLMTQQDLTGTPGTNTNYGRVGTSYPVTETSMAIIGFGVLDLGHFNNLSAARKDSLKAAINWLLGQQDLTGNATTNSNYGSWAVGNQNYDTSLAISALSFSGDVPSDPSLQTIAAAKAAGRAWEIAHQTYPSSCDPPDPTSPSQGACGGFTYSSNPGSGADASNTGFAMTGIDLTGGVPAQVATRNLFWQRHVQEISTNPGRHAGLNDGCGSYYPGFGAAGSFAYSNANDTGTMLFGFGYDGLTGSDAGVTAGLACGNNILGAYELSKDTRQMIAHHNATLDPPCHVGDAGCNYVVDGDGGYHYSMFSLSKGVGQFVAPSLTNTSNYYARIVDLLLSEQDTSGGATNGSWPPDGRDDATVIVATGFSILALGRVGQPATINGTVYDDKNGNGTRDSGEGGLQGWTVYLDANNNGALGSGEPKAVSGSSGAYTINDIEPKSYPALREVLQSGYVCTEPSNCRYAPVSLVSGQGVGGDDFGNRIPPVTGPTCPDFLPPVTTLRRRGVHSSRAHPFRLKRHTRTLKLKGKSRDRGAPCPSGVKNVFISLARVSGKHLRNCRFIRSRKRYKLTHRKNCRRPKLFKAKGTTKWKFKFSVRLKPGLYRAVARAKDKAGNKETPKKRRNIVFLTVPK